MINGTLPAGIVLTGVALRTTRGRPMHRLRPVAVAALVVLVTWILMFLGVFLALLYA